MSICTALIEYYVAYKPYTAKSHEIHALYRELSMVVCIISTYSNVYLHQPLTRCLVSQIKGYGISYDNAVDQHQCFYLK
jgi:hypothetical protein